MGFQKSEDYTTIDGTKFELGLYDNDGYKAHLHHKRYDTDIYIPLRGDGFSSLMGLKRFLDDYGTQELDYYADFMEDQYHEAMMEKASIEEEKSYEI